MDSAPPIEQLGPTEPPQATDLSSSSSFTSSSTAPLTQGARWPEPAHPFAFHGIAGDFVRLVGPQTEADPMALLMQFLTCFGNSIGRRPHFLIEADQHPARLDIVLVGQTSRGRKGTSWGHTRHLFSLADAEWVKNCHQAGLSSGEGLIWAVRDPITKLVPKSRKDPELVPRVVDQGVTDKRCLVYEGEFASVLKVLQREGNTLSAVVRNAWDTGTLKILNKNSPATATDAHISIIGHITKDEALRYLDRTELGNGFGNRICWICVGRSKLLPHGGHVPPEEIERLAMRLRDIIERARELDRVDFDNDARLLWEQMYPALTEGHAGLLGAVTARAEAQTIRLALIFALLDGDSFIRPQHLRAALAVWAYADASATYIFGDAIGDPVADAVLQALRRNEDGLDRTQIIQLFSNNRSSSEINRALASLVQFGLATPRQIPTVGRPREQWYATKKTNETKEGPGSAELPSFLSFLSLPEPSATSVSPDNSSDSDGVVEEEI